MDFENKSGGNEQVNGTYEEHSTEELRNIIDFEIGALQNFIKLFAAIERSDDREHILWEESSLPLVNLGEWISENVQKNINGVFNYIEENFGMIDLTWEDSSVLGYTEGLFRSVRISQKIQPDQEVTK